MKYWIYSLFIAATVTGAEPFPLSDSDPESPEFRRRFFASYGVNEAIDPKLTTQDRSLYEKVLPLLRTQPQEAIALVQAAIKPDSSPVFYFLLGNLHYQVNQFAQAERWLEQAVQKFPSFRRAWLSLALSQVQLGNYDQAIAPLLKVIELGGGDAQSYGLLGYAYLTLDKYESSLSAYRMARMFKPDSVDFRRGQALCLLQTHQTEGAIALFDVLIAEQPEVQEFWLSQAEGYLSIDQPQKAIVNLEIAAGMGKSSWSAQMLLGELYLNEGIVHLASATYQRALEQKRPTNWNQLLKPLDKMMQHRYFAVGRSYLTFLRSGALPEATAESQTKLSLADARIELELGDETKGLTILEEALVKDPLNGEVLLLLGKTHHRNNEYEKAIVMFERAQSVPEFRREALVALGQVSVSKGELRDAVKYLREAQQIEAKANVGNYLDAIQERLNVQ